jgi:poly-gamma-glutamate synthesis protein (capsule biosynthesis protein)
VRGWVLSALLAATSFWLPAKAQGESLTVVLLGDTGLNMSRAPVSAEGGYKFDRVIAADEALTHVRPLLSGDIVFANLETAVTDRNDLAPREKPFVFRTHPNAVRAFVGAGVNAVSLANNHTLDYGLKGGGETLKHVSALSSAGLLAWPGLGRTRDDALKPHQFPRGNAKVAFSAIGIGGKGFSLPAPVGSAGMAILDEDYDTAVRRLHDAPADVRLLSVHYGRELASFPDPVEVAQFRDDAAAADGVSIVAGHHAHVAKGVALSRRHLVAYGLGNFLHFGMRDMSGLGICRDFGLALRVTLIRDGDGAFEIDVVEAVPLTDMHVQTRIMTGDPAALRLDVINYLGAALDDEKSGTRGLRFALQADGTGAWCRAGSVDVRCAGWTEPPLAAGARLSEITRACGGRALVADTGEDERGWPAPVTFADMLVAHDAARRELPVGLGRSVNMLSVDAETRHAKD